MTFQQFKVSEFEKLHEDFSPHDFLGTTFHTRNSESLLSLNSPPAGRARAYNFLVMVEEHSYEPK